MYGFREFAATFRTSEEIVCTGKVSQVPSIGEEIAINANGRTEMYEVIDRDWGIGVGTANSLILAYRCTVWISKIEGEDNA